MKTIPAFYFDPAKLQSLAEHERPKFLAAAPFPHAVLDNFIPQEIVDLLIQEFPTPEQIAWELHGSGDTPHTGDPRIEKIACSDERQFPAMTRHFVQQLNSATFITFLEQLTGIAGLLPDPSLQGCGLHSTGPGGRLMMHTDEDRHSLAGRERLLHQRLNAIFYVNPAWREEYGGHLELWDFSARKCHTRVLPIANRLVIFDTGTRSLHGHPHPLRCPPDRRRNSLAAYYYVLGRNVGEDYSGFQADTKWVPTSSEDRRVHRNRRIKQAVLKVTPPICLDAYHLVRRLTRR